MNIFQSLSARITISLALGLVLILFTCGWFIGSSIHDQAFSLVSKEKENVLALQAENAALPLWNLDYEQLRVIIHNIAEDDAVVYAYVLDEDNKKIDINAGHEISEADAAAFATINRPITFTNQDKEENLGTLSVVFDYSSVEEQVKHLTQLMGAIVSLLLVFLVTGVYFITRHMIKPLTRLSEQLDHFSDSDTSTQLEDVSHSKVTEVRRLFIALQEMGNRIKTNTKALKLSEQRSRGIIDGSVDTIITINERGLIQSFNVSGEKMFGYASTEVIGQNVKILMPDHYAKEHNGYLEKYHDTQQKNFIGTGREVPAQRKDGSIFPMRLAISEITLDEEKIFVGMISDITQAVADRDEIRRKSEAAEEAQKEVEILFDQAELAREKAEQANKAKSEFLANMSHELRTPLNSLLLLSEDLIENEEKNLTEEQIEDLDIIHSGGKNLLVLINDILDLSKVEAGKMNVNFDNVSLEFIKRNTNASFQHMADAKGLHFSINITKDAPTHIRSDSVRLEQILRNFLSNAIKFTREGAVTLDIYVPHDDQDMIAFAVTDSGIGIPSNKQGDIFQAFQQADGSTEREYGGTGLGLSISTQLADLLGGSISLKSTEGKGSTFTITLPQKQYGEEEGDTPAEDDTLKDITEVDREEEIMPESLYPTEDFTGKSLLIVDDDARNIFSISRILGKTGIDIHTAQTGNEALELLKNNLNINIILMDILMPEMDGLEVTKKIRQQDRLSQIPIIAVTSKDIDESKDICIEAGANAHISKPFDKEALFEIVSKFLKESV